VVFGLGSPGSLITESFPVCLLGRIIAKGKKIPKIVAVVGYKRDDICAASGRRVSTRREIGPAVWRGPEHSTSTPHSLRIPEPCVDGENEREKIGGGKELVAPALANPVDPVLVSPPAVKCVVSPARAIHRLPSTSAKKRRRLPVARFVAMENLKG
jgi:hypothetical protein